MTESRPSLAVDGCDREAECEIRPTDVIPARIEPPAQTLSLLRLLRAVIRNPIESWPRAVYREHLYRPRIPGHDAIFIMHPELIRQVLVDADNFEKGEMARRALEPVLGDAILIADGARWRWQRQTTAPLFRREQLLEFLPAMISTAERTRERWLSYPPASEIDIAREMMRTTFEIVVATMLSGSSAGDTARMERAIADYLKSTSWVMALTIVGAPRWVPYPGLRKARRGRDYLRQFIDGLMTEVAHRGASRNDLFSLLIGANNPQTGRSMSEIDVRDNILTFVMAGHETTALALTWTFYLLSLHPHIEARVRAEIAAVTGGSPMRGEHIESLRYTQQVIQEAMRLYPPVPLIVREARRVLRLGTEVIGTGTLVYVPVYAVHRHEEFWDRPDVFDPDRFAPEANKARDRYIYLPFGAGPRICIGMSFAQIEATAVLAVLLSSLRLRLRQGYIPEPKLRVTLRPARGMPMRLISLA
jgi:cytochrome P450